MFNMSRNQFLEFVSSYIHHHDVSQEALKTAILAARFDAHFAGSCRVGRTYVETNNRITFFASALAELLPNAKIRPPGKTPWRFCQKWHEKGLL